MPRKESSLHASRDAMQGDTLAAPENEIYYHWRQNPHTYEVTYIGVVSQRGPQDSGFYLTPAQHEAILTADDTIVELR